MFYPGIFHQIGNVLSSPAAETATVISEGTSITHQSKKVEALGPAIAINLAFWASRGGGDRSALRKLPVLHMNGENFHSERVSIPSTR